MLLFTTPFLFVVSSILLCHAPIFHRSMRMLWMQRNICIAAATFNMITVTGGGVLLCCVFTCSDPVAHLCFSHSVSRSTLRACSDFLHCLQLRPGNQPGQSSHPPISSHPHPIYICLLVWFHGGVRRWKVSDWCRLLFQSVLSWLVLCCLGTFLF